MKNKILKSGLLFIAVLAMVFAGQVKADTVYHASDVLGQTDQSGNPIFTTGATDNGSDTPNNIGMNYPSGLVVDKTNHRMFVADANNNRILEYNLDTNNNLISYTADHIIGQTNFSDNSSATTPDGLNCPNGIAYDSADNLLFAVDNLNNRVLIYNFSGISNTNIQDGMSAWRVLGQDNFYSTVATTTQNGFGNLTKQWGQRSVDGVAYDPNHKRLFVSDMASNRVLIFDISDILNISNGMAAWRVLGQGGFTTNDAATTPGGMNWPYAITYDSVHDRLFVDDDDDDDNSRILVYDLGDNVTVTNGMPSDAVIGQPNFTSSDRIVSDKGSAQMEELAYDPVNDRLFAGDDSYNRILVFDLSNGIPETNMSASAIIGGENFTTDYWNLCDSKSSSNICDPELGMDYDPLTNKLWMTDDSNNRVLIWNFIKITNDTLDNGTVGTSYSQTLTSENSQGTVTWSETGDLDGLTLDANTGIISGTPTTAGTYTFTVKATDYLSDPQTFTDSKSFTVTIDPVPAPTPTPSGGNGAPVGLLGSSGGGGGGGSYTPQTPSRPQIVYPDGHIVYLDATTTTATTTIISTSTLSLQSQIATLTAQLNSLLSQTGLSSSTLSTSTSTYTFTRNLSLGMTGNDVKALQQYLNTHGFVIATTGAGSPGNETTKFGTLTQKALKLLQTSLGLPSTGFFGVMTRGRI